MNSQSLGCLDALPEAGVGRFRLVAILDGREGHHHRERRHGEDERRDRGDRNVQDRLERLAGLGFVHASWGSGPTTLFPL
jgi:hypothetical protein